MNLLQPILNNDLLPLRAIIILSALLSTASFADSSVPPVSSGHVTKNTTPSMSTMQPVVLPPQSSQMQAPLYYYSPQQQQYYQAMPYRYYYPQQQQPSTYQPRQWNNYPQQQLTTPYPYPVTSSSPVANTSSANTRFANARSYNNTTPRYPMRKKIKKKKNAWGDERHIWPDFYTDFTGDAWDKMINTPYDAGRMPGGWRAPSLSTPDPVTVSDAVANQMPPIMEEMGNMTNFSN